MATDFHAPANPGTHSTPAPCQWGQLRRSGGTAANAACPTCMTGHQVTVRSAVPAVRAARQSRFHRLPSPAERRRLGEQWGLITRQVAAVFEVPPVTVRSWEAGRTSPRGQRGAAYGRFLAGLAQHALLIPARTDDPKGKPPLARTNAPTIKPLPPRVVAVDEQSPFLAGTTHESLAVPDPLSPVPPSGPATTVGASVHVTYTDAARQHLSTPARGSSWNASPVRRRTCGPWRSGSSSGARLQDDPVPHGHGRYRAVNAGRSWKLRSDSPSGGPKPIARSGGDGAVWGEEGTGMVRSGVVSCGGGRCRTARRRLAPARWRVCRH